MSKYLAPFIAVMLFCACSPKIAGGLRKSDLTKDVEMVTSKGTMIIRLSDLTPLHRNNFLQLVKQHYYDSLSFHRVINHFMIQAGDPSTRRAVTGAAVAPPYTIPAEFNPTLFHRRGALAAARERDETNPKKASSGSQFYIVQGRTFTDPGLDSVQTYRLKGRKLPVTHRFFYKTEGGAPHLDSSYTVFGEVLRGLPVIDSIAAVPTGGRLNGDKPLRDVKILKVRLVKRSPYY